MSFQAPLFRPKYITLNHSSGRCSRLAPFSRIILHTRGYSTVLHHRLNPRSSRQQPAPLFRLPFTSPSIIYQNNPRANMSSEKTSGPEGNKLFTRDHLFDLSGKVALVTGMCLLFNLAGRNVVMCPCPPPAIAPDLEKRKERREVD